MIITGKAHARAGLVGNPSDGYFGKTISFIIRNFTAQVCLWESPHFEIVPGHGDLAQFESVDQFLRDVRLHGYYGGMRLIKAAVKKFHEYCRKNDRQLDRPQLHHLLRIRHSAPGRSLRARARSSSRRFAR